MDRGNVQDEELPVVQEAVQSLVGSCCRSSENISQPKVRVLWLGARWHSSSTGIRYLPHRMPIWLDLAKRMALSIQASGNPLRWCIVSAPCLYQRQLLPTGPSTTSARDVCISQRMAGGIFSFFKFSSFSPLHLLEAIWQAKIHTKTKGNTTISRSSRFLYKVYVWRLPLQRRSRVFRESGQLDKPTRLIIISKITM